jgi:hypothetical protein
VLSLFFSFLLLSIMSLNSTFVGVFTFFAGSFRYHTGINWLFNFWFFYSWKYLKTFLSELNMISLNFPNSLSNFLIHLYDNSCRNS